MHEGDAVVQLSCVLYNASGYQYVFSSERHVPGEHPLYRMEVRKKRFVCAIVEGLVLV